MSANGGTAPGQGITNIGPRERRRRLTRGIITLVLGALLGLAMVLTGVDRWWRLVLFLPFWMGGLGVHQARGKTCVVLAARGARNMDDGIEPVEDEQDRRVLRRQARLVYIQTSAAAIVPTALGLIMPG
jgi:hypothetical protein